MWNVRIETSIKENAFTLFLPIPSSTTKAAIHLFKTENKENKERDEREGKKLKQRERRKKETKEEEEWEEVSKTFSHVIKKNDGGKKVREGGATGRQGGRKKNKKIKKERKGWRKMQESSNVGGSFRLPRWEKVFVPPGSRYSRPRSSSRDYSANPAWTRAGDNEDIVRWDRTTPLMPLLSSPRVIGIY